ncbi:MAG: DUF1501 domain-containing protein, partial [Candidatus Eisenbacteria bacterium]|nr:DUF1501 domain-containing protein [Candidatus Eisenbacteria bacterium]
MKRRDFLQRTLQYSAAGLLVPSFLRHGGWLDPATAQAASDLLAGQILVLVNLSGGNDGINMVPPYLDPVYYQVRPNLAIPADQVVPIANGTGLHPSLAPLQAFHTEGKLAVIQGVGYPSMNLSHFRGTDIWFSGSSAEAVISTGWLARFLERLYPEFPDLKPESPFALQQALAHRIPLTGDRGVTGVIVDDPSTFFALVNGSYSGEWSDELPDTRGGDELTYVREIDQDTFEYAAAIQNASENGTNTVVYPQSTLGGQLEIVARLISGGLGTPIFLTAEFGFDTHAQQAASHAQILGSVGSSVAAFLNDLRNQGLSQRVLVLTQSEFGRRVSENGSLGTDHGTAAPMLAVGDPVAGGVFGTNPDLTNLDPNGNLLIQHDYRAVYQTVLQNHFGASGAVAQDVLYGDFGTIPF